MAWRPTEYLIDGMVDCTQPDRVSGTLRFAGLPQPVTLNLVGRVHRDVRGVTLKLKGNGASADAKQAAEYMQSFDLKQTGKVGDITAGRPPADYVHYPYIEWYSEENGRVVLELHASEVEIAGQPISACESDPVSREEQDRNMDQFMRGLLGAE